TSFLAAPATHPTLLVTGIVDLDAGRLIDVLPARSARAVTDWLAAKPAPWRAGIRHVAIEPSPPHSTAGAAPPPPAGPRLVGRQAGTVAGRAPPCGDRPLPALRHRRRRPAARRPPRGRP